MTDDSPRLHECTTVTLITPGRWRLAGVRVATVRTDRMASLVEDYKRLNIDGDTGVEVLLVWPSDSDRLDEKFRRVGRDRLDDLAKLIDRYDERLASDRKEVDGGG